MPTWAQDPKGRTPLMSEIKVLLLPCPMETQLSPTSMVQQVKLISGQTNMNAISTGTWMFSKSII